MTTRRRKGKRSPGRDKLTSPVNARELAFVVLSQHKSSGELIAPLLEPRLGDEALSPGDRALASEIIYGIVRRQATLNTVLQRYINRPRHRVEGELWTLLQIGAYQLIFLDSVPAHAAVNETVNVARRIGHPRWSGFLNGVMRSVAREQTDELADAPAANAIPLTEGRYRRWSAPIFANPEADLQGYVSQAFSFPDWLIERWQLRFEAPELLRVCFWFNSRAEITLRVNLLKTTRDALLEEFRAAGVSASAGGLPEAVRLQSSARIETLPGFDDGRFSVQDSSAMHAARLLAPQRGERLLDLCAAPGTKTAHLAECLHDDGTILATDVRQQRLRLIEENCRRLGITSVEARLIQPDGGDLPDGPFDAALVDVPCSNTGVLGKRPEARWRISPRDLSELPELQLRLLTSACQRVRDGGRVVYSTCSIEPEENQHVVHQALELLPQVQLAEELVHVPGQPGDGWYQALLSIRTHRVLSENGSPDNSL